MNTIQINTGDTWDIAHWKIRQYLFALFSENTPERGDRLMALYDLLYLGQWEQKWTTLTCQYYRDRTSSKDTLKRCLVGYALTDMVINPELMTIDLGSELTVAE